MRSGTHIAIAVLIVSGHADAQPANNKANADRLFDEGRESAENKRWQDACSKFEVSLRYDDARGTRLNLADCYEHIDELGGAWALYRELTEGATKPDDVKRSAYAQKRLAVLEAQLAKLTIVMPASPPRGFVVTRNGIAIKPGGLRVVLYVDAGQHEVAASAPDCDSFMTMLTLAARGDEIVVVPNLTPRPAPPPDRALTGADVPTPLDIATPRADEPAVETGRGPSSGPVISPPARQPVPGNVDLRGPATQTSEALERALDASRAEGRRLRSMGTALGVTGVVMLMTNYTFAGEVSPTDRKIFVGAAVAAIGAGATLFGIGHHRATRRDIGVVAAPLRGGAAAMLTGRW